MSGAAGSGPFVRVVVADTGSGMSEETLRHAFEPFFTTKEPGKGTGMGLASVYGAVQIHKGKISVESALGKGTTFQIDLPVSHQPGAEPQAPRAEAVSLAGRRALVIDDEEEVRDVIREVLSRAGCAVVACSDGESGIAAFAARWREIDVVILDLVMPKMGGRAVFSALQQTDPNVRVLVLSGHSLDGETRSLLDDGAQALLDKPFHAEALVAKVDACASRHPRAEKAREVTGADITQAP
jgi:CheY-like chemotaxis protein